MLDVTKLVVPVAVLCGAHVLFSIALRLLLPSTAGRRSKGGTLIADGVAYNTVVVIAQSAAALLGTSAWFALDSGSGDERLYSAHEHFRPLLLVTASFELYNTLASVALAEWRTAVYIGHHITTLLLALLGDDPPLLHYYGFFFFGVAQISSVPLALLELAELLELPLVHQVSRVAFAIAFLILRSVAWLFVSASFWRDTLAAMQYGGRSLGPLSVFLAANIFLTGLQLLWTGRVVRGVLDALGIGAGEAKKSE